jgi:integrase
MTDLAPVMQAFFTDRLATQLQASPHTVASYRDAFRLLIRHASAATGRPPSELSLTDLDAPRVTSFLAWLKDARGNSAATRNSRLAAIHSLFAYASLHRPDQAAVIQRVLAIPQAKTVRKTVDHLTDAEAEALIASCGRTTRTGRRDHALILLALDTGLRASEITGLRTSDARTAGPGAHVHCLGKGRKHRATPLRAETAAILAAWTHETGGEPGSPLFPNPSGRPLSRDAIQKRVRLAAARAAEDCPSLAGKNISPHTLRHTAAVRLLKSGVPLPVISLWLGHEHTATTEVYLHADMETKQQALNRSTPLAADATPYRPDDALLAFLDNL